MNIQKSKNKVTTFASYSIIFSILLLFFLNFYIISPEGATEIIIREAHAGNLTFDLTEEQRQEIVEVLYGVEEHNLPSLSMKFNKEIELREGLIQIINIEVIDTKDMGERAISKYRGLVRIGLTDQQAEGNERIYSGLVVLNLDRVSMRKWEVKEIQTLPFRDNTI